MKRSPSGHQKLRAAKPRTRNPAPLQDSRYGLQSGIS
jgi:hypothetical protein